MSQSPEQPHNPEQEFDSTEQQGIDQTPVQRGEVLASQIKDLQSKAQTKEDYLAIESKIKELRSLFTPETSETVDIQEATTTPEKAKEIMGKYFFGIEAFKHTFRLDGGMPDKFKKVPYSEAQLEQAKQNGEMLVLRHSLNPDPSTMKDIHERLEKVFSIMDGHALMYKDWYENENFFTKQPIREGWALVSKDVIENSTSKNYIDQTATLRDYLKDLGSITADELAECTDEKLDEIRDFLRLFPTSTIYSTKVHELKINQNHRRNPAEALYDFAIRFKNTPDNERMLGLTSDWTNARGSRGRIIYFGESEFDGVRCEAWEPSALTGFIGVVSVR